MKFLLLIIGLITIGGIYIVISQSYPVAFVGWQSISAQNFNDNFNTAVFYYGKVMETYNKNATSSIESINSPAVKTEIKRAVMDKSIENILILNELEKRLKNSELDQMVKNKIDEILKGQDIEKQVATIYALSLNAFKERVLIPEARLEILQARLMLENKNFDDWLASAKKQAKVVILVPGLGWNGEGVAVK
mgnify:FL=1